MGQLYSNTDIQTRGKEDYLYIIYMYERNYGAVDFYVSNSKVHTPQETLAPGRLLRRSCAGAGNAQCGEAPQVDGKLYYLLWSFT